MNKTRIMTVCDSIYAGTGFSEEMRNIMFRIASLPEYEIYWMSLQHTGYPIDIPDTMFPDLPKKGITIKILGGAVGPLGYDSFVKHFNSIKPDIVFDIGDPHHFLPQINYKRKEPFTFLAYTTLDGLPIYPPWKKIFDEVDVPIAMTNWAYKAFMEAGCKMSGFVHHGVNWQYMTANPERRAKLKKHFGIDENCIIFGNWDANQFRKQDPALLRAWKKVHPERKNMKLFLNKDTNCQMGYNLYNLVEQYNIPRETVIFPEDLSPTGDKKYFEMADEPVHHKEMCELFDVFVSATGGEGFGKTSLEALSLGLPVIITDYSACSEVCEKGSILIPHSGVYRDKDSAKVVDLALIDVDKLTEAIIYLYNNSAERQELGLEAREWAKEFDYDTKVFPAWQDVLSRINPDVILANNLLRYGT